MYLPLIAKLTFPWISSPPLFLQLFWLQRRLRGSVLGG
jgi:hypothetical protein